MTRITGLRTFDLRFPTSQSLDGSDAMNPDPGLFRRLCHPRQRQRHRGARANLHDRARQRHLLRGDRGDAASGGRAGARLGQGKSRPVLASSHRRQPVALDRSGQGRDASRHRRGGQCRLGSVGQGSGQAGVAAGRRDEPGRRREDRRLPLPHRRADAGRSARHPARAPSRARPSASPRSSARAMPATRPRPAGSAIPTTSCGGFARKRSTPASTTSR